MLVCCVHFIVIHDMYFFGFYMCFIHVNCVLCVGPIALHYHISRVGESLSWVDLHCVCGQCGDIGWIVCGHRVNCVIRVKSAWNPHEILSLKILPLQCQLGTVVFLSILLTHLVWFFKFTCLVLMPQATNSVRNFNQTRIIL